MREHGYLGYEPITGPSSTSASGVWSKMRVMELARRNLWPLNNTYYLPDILSRLQYVVTAQANRVPANNPANDTITITSGHGIGIVGVFFNGSVLLNNNKVFCIPRDSISAKTYDPSNNTWQTCSGSYPGSGAFNGGVLLPDGRVFCVPFNSTTARIYDPSSDTTITLSGSYPGSGAFNGGVLLPDGRVFLVPAGVSARIYDPSSQNVIIVSAVTGAYAPSVLLPNGNVFCCPNLIYNPNTGLTTNLTLPSGIINSFSGSVLLPDGRVFCVPHNQTTAIIYNPANNSFFTSTATFPTGVGSFLGGVLLPDGRVLCVPSNQTTAKIYNPITDTLTTPSGVSFPGNYGFNSGVLLSDGRVFCCPLNASSARILTGDFANPTFNFDSTTLLSGYLNKY